MPTIDINNPASQEPAIRAAFLNLSARPNTRRLAALGDSRVASIYIDPENAVRRYKTASSQINWAFSLTGHRCTLSFFGGVSGNRTDQIRARLPQAIASGAGLFYILGGVNDIAQDYPTAAASGATAAANIIAMSELCIQAGGEVILETEIGSQNFTLAQIGQMMLLNQTLRDYVRSRAHVHLHDATHAVMDAGFSATAVRFRTGFSYDGTHLSPRGAYHWGKSLAGLLAGLVPPAFVNQISRFERSSQNRLQLIENTVFATASGGTPGAGNSGTLPAGTLGERSGGASAAFSVAASPSGIGNTVTIDATFSAAGEAIRIAQDITAASWAAGDIVEGLADISVTQPGVLVRAGLNMQFTIDGTTFDHTDHFSIINNPGPAEAYAMTLRTDIYTVAPHTTKNWAALSVELRAAAAGTAQVKVQMMAIRRLLSA